MTDMTTANANRSFLPEQVDELVVQPVEAASIATQVSRTVHTPSGVNKFRVPIITADPTAAWTEEGGEIIASNAGLSEVDTPFYKLAGLTVISNELADDSSPAAAEVIGDGLSRDISRKLDAAFFGASGSADQPDGLEDLVGPNEVAGEGWTNLDSFTEAIYQAESVGATLTSFVANPDDALWLALLKDEDGSNRPLLGFDPTVPTRRQIHGVPLFISSAVTPGTIWGIPGDRVIVALREDTTLTIDKSAYFTHDQTGIRAIMRVAFAFPHPAAIQKIELSGS